MGYGGGGKSNFSNMDKPLDADGDGIVSQEEWEEEWAMRGDIAGAVTRTTTPYQLAVNYPGATVKNQIGPRSPVVLNTPFTAVQLPANPPPNPDTPWSKGPVKEETAATMFEAQLKAARMAQTQYAKEVNGVILGKK